MVEEEIVGEGKVREEGKRWRRVDGVRLSGWRSVDGGEVPEEDRGWRRDGGGGQRMRGDGVRVNGRRRDKRSCWRKKEKCRRYWKIESCVEVQRRWRKSVD